MITVNLHFVGPQIVKESLEDGRLKLKLKTSYFLYDVVISKIGKNKFHYHDLELFERTFDNLDYLLWEFELPRSLKQTIESLPIVKIKKI